MCPLCMTNAVLVVAGAASSAGVVGFVAVKVRALRRRRHEPRTATGIKEELASQRRES